MTESIQVYADGFAGFRDGDTNNISLTGIDASQVLAEFSDKEKLENVELSAIYDYIKKLEAENE